ncbi:hypothetical protein DFS34DRAFT_605564 [Phlyctochytrium arcticum]|nr:hypothetical protein DFS34DRAFT_605564 [Phlyctochytrium arcticum]
MPSNIYSNILPMSRPSSVPSTLTTTTSPLTNLPLGSINIPANHAPLWNNPYLTNIASLPIGQLFSRVNSTMESTGVIGTSPVAPSGVVPQMGQGIIPYVPSLTTPLLQLVGNVRPTLVNSSVGVCILPRVVSGHTLPSVGPTIVTATESLPMVAVAGTDATSAAPTAEEVPLEPPPPPKPKPHPTWHTCLPCRTNSHFSSFDLCPPCFTTHEESTHLHPIPSFSITNLRERKLQRQAEAKKRKADMAQRADERRLAMAERRKRREERVRDVVGAGIGVMNGLGGVRCAYCWVELTEGWRKGYNGIPMCEACFKLAASTFDVEEDKQDEEVPQSGTTASAEAEIHPESSSVEATAEQPEQQQRYDSGSPEVNTGSNVGDSEPVQTPPQRSDPDPIEVEPERHIIEDAPTMDQAQLLISKNITEPSAEGGENVNLHNEVQSLSSQELESPVAEDVIDTNRDQNATAAARVLDPTSLRGVYSTELEAYSHEYYLTRGVVGKASAGSGHSGTVAYEMSANGAILDSGTGSGQQNSVFKDPKRDFETLSSYAPTDDHLFTLRFDTSFYDIPGRAPRWATHSGGDYHGTWLPQVVRMSLLRYTRPGARVLSNFSGRGTDAIEAFLCRRKLCAVDINPASVALSQRNVSFAIPPTSDLSAAYRPVIVCADSRNLVGSLFAAASYDHVLSHPPYKDCISYSAHIEGDLSHFPDPLVFQSEMRKVALETYRLLKPHKRVTLGMGDNRRDCFYQPVSFDTIKTYMDVGFEVESLIVKRQRYCQMAPLGTWLCTRYDFLMFTHEFVAILRKKEWSSIQDGECLTEDGAESEDVSNNLHEIERTQRRIPTSPIDRSSIVMGTVWTFTTCAEYALSRLAMSKIVERFGKDGGVWEEIGFSALENHVLSQVVYHDICQNPETDEERETTEIGNVEEEEEVDVMTAYERRRRDQLVKNNRELLSMGLISDLSPEGQDDASSLSTLLSIPTLPKNALHSPHLVFVPHINVPPTGLVKKDWIPGYRRMLQRLATEVEPRVEVGGYLIVGVKDVHVILDEGGETRDTEPTSSTPPSPQTKFIPLGLLVNEDLTAQFANSDSSQSTSRFRLKDFIVAVPDGLAKSKSLSIDILKRQVAQDEVEWKLENETDVRRLAPIVHAYYFVYMKV